jgi:hypothetical protein
MSNRHDILLFVTDKLSEFAVNLVNRSNHPAALLLSFSNLHPTPSQTFIRHQLNTSHSVAERRIKLPTS